MQLNGKKELFLLEVWKRLIVMNVNLKYSGVDGNRIGDGWERGIKLIYCRIKRCYVKQST